MKKKTLKGVVSCILAAVMIFSIAIPAFAETGSTIDSPIIVINGINNNPLVSDPDTSNAKVVFPPTDEEIEFTVGEMLTLAVTSMASGDYSEILNWFVGSQLYKKFEAIQLNPDGTSKSENLGVNTYTHSISYYNTDDEMTGTVAGSIGLAMADRVGGKNVYVFTYDWRLDPLETAEKLKDYIAAVKKNSGKDSVSIISEGYGSTIATTYLCEFYDDATGTVKNFVTVNSAFEGTSLIGDIFTGRLQSQSTNVANQTFSSAFIRYTNDVSDNVATWFSTWLTNYILNRNWEVQSLCMDISVMMSHVKKPLYEKYLKQMLRNFTGLWAMVPTDYYDDAVDFMFDESTDSTSNTEFIEKIQTFKNYQANASDYLNKAKSEGINISIVSSWDLQLIPLGDNSTSDDEMFGISAQSDGLIDTYYSSFGATCIPLNDVGDAINHEQVNTDGECANHNHMCDYYDYLDPDHRWGGIAHYIDASTCALPENTWFIHNMKHGTFDKNSNSADFLVWLVTASKMTSVWSNVYYMQFLNYNRYVNPGYLTLPVNQPNPAYLLGDVNLDGKINAADARLTLRIAAKLEEYPKATSVIFKNADVNGDGVITAADARIILRVSAALNSFDDFKHTSDVDESSTKTTPTTKAS